MLFEAEILRGSFFKFSHENMERANICIETVNTTFFQRAAFSSHAMIAFLTRVLLMIIVMSYKSLEKT